MLVRISRNSRGGEGSLEEDQEIGIRVIGVIGEVRDIRMVHIHLATTIKEVIIQGFKIKITFPV